MYKPDYIVGPYLAWAPKRQRSDHGKHAQASSSDGGMIAITANRDEKRSAIRSASGKNDGMTGRT